MSHNNTEYSKFEATQGYELQKVSHVDFLPVGFPEF